MKRGTPDHPKVAQLALEIDQPIYAAVGLLEMLWHFTAEFCPRGNVGKFPDKSICAGMKWGKSRINLIEALISCGLLEHHSEHRLIVHDWQDHADQSVRRRLERSGEEFVTSQQLVTDESVTSTSLPKPEPKPEPKPTPPAEPEIVDEPKPPSELDAQLSSASHSIHERHPNEEGRRDISENAVRKELAKISKRFPPIERVLAVQRIDANHAGWCDYWRAHGYTKGLKNWLAPTEERYLASPPANGAIGPPRRGYDKAAEASRLFDERILEELGRG